MTSTIAERIEFFFSDGNFRRDKFLKQQASENPEGFVAIEVLLRFNTLKALTENEEEVAKAAESLSSVVLSEDRKMIRRAQGEVAAIDTKEHILCLEGLPLDITWIQVKETLEGMGVPVTYVQLRRKEGVFNGEANVELKNKDDAAKVTTEGALTFKGATEIKAVMLSTKIAISKAKKAKKAEEAEKAVQEAIEAVYPKDALLIVSDIPDNMNWIDLKKAIAEHGRVMFVDINMTDHSGYVRVFDSDDAKQVLKSLDGKVSISEEEYAVVLADESKQKQYWDRMFAVNKERAVLKKIEAIRSEFENSKNRRNKGRGKKFKKKVLNGNSNSTPLGKRQRSDEEATTENKGLVDVAPVAKKAKVDAKVEALEE